MVHSLKPELYRAELRIYGDFRGNAYAEVKGKPPLGFCKMAIEPAKHEVSYDILVMSCTSICSYFFSMYGRGEYGASTLLEILGPGKLFGGVTYRIFNGNMKPIGEISQKVEGGIRVLENGRKALTIVETSIEGSCWGDECKPGKVRTSPGYLVYLRRVDDETIEGNYNHLIYIDQGKIYVAVKSIYHKKDMRAKMPFDEIIIYRMGMRSSGSREDVPWTHVSLALPAEPARIAMT